MVVFRVDPTESGPDESRLCHDSFRRAKEARRRQAPSSPDGGEERALWLVNVALVAPISAGGASAAAGGDRARASVRLRAGRIEAVVGPDDGPSPSDGGPEEEGAAAAAVVLDCAGLLLLPGLMDAHVHVTAVIADLTALRALPPSLVAARAGPILNGMIARGFTTVRDAGGADWGLAAALEEGSILGPRLLISGRALSQTGGHGDMRARGAEALEPGGGCPCACACAAGIGRVCDGADAVRLAAREELRLGAHWIKLMASGGVSSPTDALEQPQFSEGELRAACDEARRRGAYAGAHAYTPASISRAVAAGVRSIEHGNYLDAACAAQMARAGAFLVPTLVTYDALVSQGAASGFPAALVDKARGVAGAGARSLALAREAGVRVCYGSDLLGPMHAQQSREFELRLEGGCSAREVLEQATANCAALFYGGGGGGGAGDDLPEGAPGRIAAGAAADLILVAADPTLPHAPLRALAAPDGAGVALVVKDGIVAKAPRASVGDSINRALFAC
jgi:imidazolonepropionase-like amidohydrolase